MMPERTRTPLQTLTIVVFSIAAIVFGVVTVHRSAFLSRKMGDLGVYLRAGWAIRAGVNPYDVTCDNGWHYVYPPPYAILMAPLADPPASVRARSVSKVDSLADASDSDRFYLPFAVSVALCYLLNLSAFLAGIHLLARTIERGQPPNAERWWWLRLAPFVVCVVPLGGTLGRGQVNALLVFLICGFIASWIERRNFRAGLYLASAIALKVMPAFLILLPLWWRNHRCLAGVAVGLVAWLGLFPLVTIGPERTLGCYQRLVVSSLAPGLRLGGDDTRKRELIHTTATDNQSFGAVLHCWLHPDRATRPFEAALWTHRTHWVLVGLFALVTLGLAGREPGSPARLTLVAGALTAVMMLASPVCHLHYLLLLTPLVMGAIAFDWDRRRWGDRSISWGRHWLHLSVPVLLVLPELPGCELLRDFGLGLGVVVIAWALALWRYAVFATLFLAPRLDAEQIPHEEIHPAAAGVGRLGRAVIDARHD